jgi:tetratricopeptide (TPR) repeat protein
MRKSLKLKSEVFTDNDLSLSTLYLNFASLYDSLNEHNRQIEYIKKALDIQLETLPADRPEFTKTFTKLAVAYHKQGQLKDTLPWYLKALQL